MYDLDPTKDDEKDPAAQPLAAPAAAPQSAYGALTAPAAAPAEAPKPKGSGFVNFDRYVGANKDALDTQRANQQAAVNSRFAALNTGLANTQKDIAALANGGALQGPPQGVNLYNGGSETEHGDGYDGGVRQISYTDAKANAAKGYGGPSQADVDSKYASLLAERDRLQTESMTGPVGGSAFDRTLQQNTGKVDYSALGDTAKAYDQSYAASTKAINDAGAATADNASKWGALVDTETEAARTAGIRAEQQAKLQARNAEVRNAWRDVQREDLLERQGFSTEAVNEIARAVKQGTISTEDLAALNKAAASGGNPLQLSSLWVDIKKRLRGAGKGNDVKIVGQG